MIERLKTLNERTFELSQGLMQCADRFHSEASEGEVYGRWNFNFPDDEAGFKVDFYNEVQRIEANIEHCWTTMRRLQEFL